MAVLHFGVDSAVDLELADALAPVECGGPRGRALEDVEAAVAAALSDPLGYPPLARGTTPGDHVVLALDRGLPHADQVVAAVVACLVEAGVDPDGVAVLRPQADTMEAGDPCGLLSEACREQVTLLAHDPHNRQQLAYLANTAAGEPILISRTLHDADLVLPIGYMHSPRAADYYGIHTPVFPTFSDERTLHRFRSFAALETNGRRKRELTAEVDEVAWLLGVNFTIQLVPASGDRILHVVAGQSDAVRQRGGELYEAAWSCPVAAQADLVVAAIEGDATQQTWQVLGRALAAATELVEDGGSIAICCDLADAPGPAVQRLVGARSRRDALRHIRKERPCDALPAAQLAQALDRGRVYLLSRLDPALVEGLEMVPVAAPRELARLTRQHKSCILLANAAHAVVTLP